MKASSEIPLVAALAGGAAFGAALALAGIACARSSLGAGGGSAAAARCSVAAVGCGASTAAADITAANWQPLEEEGASRVQQSAANGGGASCCDGGGACGGAAAASSARDAPTPQSRDQRNGQPHHHQQRHQHHKRRQGARSSGRREGGGSGSDDEADDGPQQQEQEQQEQQQRQDVGPWAHAHTPTPSRRASRTDAGAGVGGSTGGSGAAAAALAGGSSGGGGGGAQLLGPLSLVSPIDMKKRADPYDARPRTGCAAPRMHACLLALNGLSAGDGQAMGGVPASRLSTHLGARPSTLKRLETNIHPSFQPKPYAYKHNTDSYLPWDDYFMAVAFLSAQRSKDPNKQVGAVIVSRDNIILSIGYNGFPRGCPDGALPWAKRSRTGGVLGTKYPYVVHAEANALLNKNQASVEGAVRLPDGCRFEGGGQKGMSAAQLCGEMYDRRAMGQQTNSTRNGLIGTKNDDAIDQSNNINDNHKRSASTSRCSPATSAPSC